MPSSQTTPNLLEEASLHLHRELFGNHQLSKGVKKRCGLIMKTLEAAFDAGWYACEQRKEKRNA